MTEKEAKDYIFGSIEAYGNICNQWCPIFTNSDRYVHWLRRNALSIWVCGLIDYLQKENNRISALGRFQANNEIVTLIKLFDHTTKSILGEINEETQILIWFIRNQCLHGHLSLFYHDNLGVSLFDRQKKSIEKKVITRAYLSNAIDMANQGDRSISNILLDNEEYKYLISNLGMLLSVQSRDKYHKMLFSKEMQ